LPLPAEPVIKALRPIFKISRASSWVIAMQFYTTSLISEILEKNHKKKVAQHHTLKIRDRVF